MPCPKCFSKSHVIPLGILLDFDMFSNFKSLKRGNNDEVIDSKFGMAICNELGFGSLQFIGSREEYQTFTGQQKSPEQICSPDFLISGANCACKRKKCRLRKCRLKNFKKEGNEIKN